MGKRSLALRRKRMNPGGGLLAACAILLAAAACALASPPTPREVAAVFAFGTPAPSAAVAAVTLPARSWYVVDAEGQAVAACEELLEAEIVRAAHGDLASIRRLTTEEVALRVTASAAQLDALSKSAGALGQTFDTLSRMAHEPEPDALASASAAKASLDSLCLELDSALLGTENPIVRGLAGLIGSCRDAMGSLAQDASPEQVRLSRAALALQYEAYVGYLADSLAGESAPSA